MTTDPLPGREPRTWAGWAGGGREAGGAAGWLLCSTTAVKADSWSNCWTVVEAYYVGILVMLCHPALDSQAEILLREFIFLT